MERPLGEQLEAIIAPFAGDAPYGEFAQYGERYEAIQREIQKMTSTAPVDWEVVKKLSIELLSEESKDLSIACYLTVALFLLEGYAGARDGLEIVHSFVADHWEGIHPPHTRLARRANDLRWLIDRLAPLIENRKPQSTDGDHIAAMIGHANSLGDLARQHLVEKAPAFGELVGPLTARASEAQASAPPQPAAGDIDESAATPSTVSATTPAAEPAAAAPAEDRGPAPTTAPAAAALGLGIASDATATEIRSQLETVIKPLRDADPLSPIPYRFLRILKWEGVSGPPQAGPTRIPGPRANEVTPLLTMLQANNWTGLIDRSENMFKAGHIWFLDLQWYTATSLERLDPKGAESRAASAIRELTAAVLKRNPTLIDCLYADGLPFASEEARSWLLEISTVDDHRVRVGRAASDDEETAAFEPGDLDRAIELLRAKKLSEGMEVLQRGIKRARNRRSEFRARLDAARTCLDANQAAWARPILEALEREAQELTFDTWEPSWAVELYQLLAICYGRLAKAAKGDVQQDFSAMVQRIHDVLCRLDMQAAAAIQDEL